MDKLKGWKTVIINALVFVAGLLTAAGIISPSPEEITAAGETIVGIIAAGVAAVNMFLRYITTTAVGSKQ